MSVQVGEQAGAAHLPAVHTPEPQSVAATHGWLSVHVGVQTRAAHLPATQLSDEHWLDSPQAFPIGQVGEHAGASPSPREASETVFASLAASVADPSGAASGTTTWLSMPASIGAATSGVASTTVMTSGVASGTGVPVSTGVFASGSVDPVSCPVSAAASCAVPSVGCPLSCVWATSGPESLPVSVVLELLQPTAPVARPTAAMRHRTVVQQFLRSNSIMDKDSSAEVGAQPMDMTRHATRHSHGHLAEQQGLSRSLHWLSEDIVLADASARHPLTCAHGLLAFELNAQDFEGLSPIRPAGHEHP